MRLLDHLDDGALDGALVLVRLLDALPRLLEGRALGGEDQTTVLVFFLEDEGLDVLAELDDLVRVDALADGELVGGDQTLGLVPDVHEHLVLVYADDVALDDVAVLEVYEDGLVYRDYLPVLFPEEVPHG